MGKKMIRQKLIDYLTELKMNLGLSKSFEVVFNYIDFIKTDSYLKELMKPFLERAEKEIKNIFDLYEKEKENINEDEELSLKPIEILPEEIPDLISSEIPIFKEELVKMGNVIKNDNYVNIMFFKHLYFTLLFSIYYKMTKVKKLQKEGRKEEDLEIIEEIKEMSIFPLPSIKIGDKPETKGMMTGQAIYNSMFIINKYIIDEIDSRIILEDNLPKKKIYYNDKDSILHIREYSIKIQFKSAPPVEHYILKTIFEDKDIARKVYFYEISENEGDEYSDNWNRYRNACVKLNEKILKQSNYNINDFIIHKTGIDGWCKIDKKYL